MPTATRPRGVVDVTYVEDDPSSSNQTLVFPDGHIVRCDAEWIAGEIEAGTFLLISLVDRDELIRRLG